MADSKENYKENSKENYKRIIEAIRREMPDFRIEGKYEPMETPIRISYLHGRAQALLQPVNNANRKDRLHDPGLLLIKENRPE